MGFSPPYGRGWRGGLKPTLRSDRPDIATSQWFSALVLYGKVTLPGVVRDELSAPQTPVQVRTWLASSPSWLEARTASVVEEQLPRKLDRGERAAIALAIELGASLVLMDDRAGVDEARRRGLAVTGTLGVLLLAAHRRLVDLEAEFLRLKTTNFRYSPALLEAMLAAWRKDHDR